MDVDNVLSLAGPLGRTQVLLVITTMLVNIETSVLVLNNVFLAKLVPHHCSNHSGYSLEESVPFKNGLYSECTEYSYPGLSNETRACGSWRFDTSVSGHSIVSEWSLVCSKDILPRLSQSLLVAGFAIGSIFAGTLSDRYGRRPTIIIALAIFNVLQLSLSLTQSYVTFVVVRFFVGAVFKAIRIPVMNLLFETLVPKHRPVVGILPSGMISVGFMMMAGIAYLIRNWRYLNVVLTIPTIILMVYSWIIPESVRWLVSQQRWKHAERVMQRIAAFNKAGEFPSPVFAAKQEQSLDNYVCSHGKETAMEEMKRDKRSGIRTFLLLFRRPVLTVTLVLSWNWLTCTLTYFGFSLSTGRLAGNPYLNFFLSSTADLFGYIVAAMVIRRIGTPRLLIFGLTSSALTITVILIRYYAVESEVVSKVILTTCALLGRFLIKFATLPSILMMSDLFPTTIRNTGTAVVHLVGNIGSFVSPLMLYMDKYFENFSFVVMVCCCISAAIFSLLLPDTIGTIQPDTTADLQKMFDTKRIMNCHKRDRTGSSDDTRL